MQVNCRDRNRIALQADLLAGAACGIRNVMAVTGEEPGFGDHHQARSVYDIDLLELLRTITSLENGKDMAGIELDGAPSFLVGSTSIAGSRGKSMELALEELRNKVAAGARFFVTPPLFDIQELSAFQKKVESEPVKILPTVVLLKSLGMARYMARNMAHVYIPEDLIRRIQKSGDKVRECRHIATEMIATLRKEGCGGVMIATIGWEHKLPEILESI
jgi:5,10-methylenetetrahydrofolate reductase